MLWALTTRVPWPRVHGPAREYHRPTTVSGRAGAVNRPEYLRECDSWQVVLWVRIGVGWNWKEVLLELHRGCDSQVNGQGHQHRPFKWLGGEGADFLRQPHTRCGIYLLRILR